MHLLHTRRSVATSFLRMFLTFIDANKPTMRGITSISVVLTFITVGFVGFIYLLLFTSRLPLQNTVIHTCTYDLTTFMRFLQD